MDTMTEGIYNPQMTPNPESIPIPKMEATITDIDISFKRWLCILGKLGSALFIAFLAFYFAIRVLAAILG